MAATIDITPTEQDRRFAAQSSRAFSRFVDTHEAVGLRGMTTEPSEEIILPDAIVRLLHEVITHFAEGETVTIVPRRAELTTNEAAEFLGVSRTHVIKLLDSGQVAFHHVGEHRRIPLDDLRRYKEDNKAKRLDVLAKLQEQAQELNMGY